MRWSRLLSSVMVVSSLALGQELAAQSALDAGNARKAGSPRALGSARDAASSGDTGSAGASKARDAASPRATAGGDVVESLLARMTLEEKAGQLSQWGAQATPTGPRLAKGGEDDVRKGLVGSFIGMSGADATRQLQREAVESSRLHIPILFSFDVIHGFRTIFPIPLAEAASWDVALAERSARAAALEATAHGLHWTYAPMIDISRDARWGRVMEGAGEDPFLGAAFAVARVRGFQGGSVQDATTMIATAKHFVGYGAAEAGRDYNPAELSERTLREIYLPPFQAAVEAGVGSVMTAFHDIAGIPMHAHQPLVRDLLRGVWGFSGVVVSDYTGIRELISHGVAATQAEAGSLGMRATVDVDMLSRIYTQDLPQLVRSGQVPQSLVDDAVRRVLEAKRRLGLFEDPYRYSDPERQRTRTRTRETLSLAREAGSKSIVLLKNEDDLLPLRKDLRTLAVVGALANDPASVLGGWNAAGLPEEAVPLLDGIRAAISPKTKLLYARGAAPNSRDTRGIDQAVRAALEADVVVAVVGEDATMSGEARSRAWIGLPGAQQLLLERLQAIGKPLVIVLMNGRPLAVPWVVEHAPAILETWFLGSMMGHAVADVLFGAVNPSGKLPITFPRAVGQVPLYYNHRQTGRPPAPKDRYTSKYLDVPWTPLFPFGHGLSYTSFAYDEPRLSATRIGPRDTLTVLVTVRNTGKRAGEETVQLYLRDDFASSARPIKALRGFARVALAPGSARELSFTLDAEDFALLDPTFQRVVEPGAFTVYVGGSSEQVKEAHFEVTAGTQLPGPGSAIPRFLRSE